MVPKTSTPAVDEDEVMPDYDPVQLPPLYGHRRSSSTSSKGGSEFDIPHNTDFEDDDEGEDEIPEAPPCCKVRVMSGRVLIF